ncbi:MAG: type II secretion system F family protein [Azoarcus sp.]|jgi:type IV pilus assembly protein PilC|nr:type II secretion system F family protein [Azoarcus sp.]
MSCYRYRACGAHGQIVQGEIEAASPAELETRLRGRGLEPIHIKTARSSWLTKRQRIPRRELIHFCFHLEQMFGAGVPILDALAELTDGQGHPGVKAVASGLYAEVERGQPLSSAMKQYPQDFDEVFRCMLCAGESTGDIAPVLRQIATDLARADEIGANARKIVIYPLVVGSVLCVAIAVALTQVVPQVATLFRSNGQVLPLSTRLLIGLSDWFRHYAWLLPLIVIPSSVALFMTAARRPSLSCRLHAFALRLPIVGPITQRLALARTANLLAMLYANGITMIDAIASTARATPNLAIRQGIEAAGAHIAAGRGIANAFESTGFFPRLVTRMLRVGEQTGRIDSALGQLVYFYERDAREAIERLQASIEPALTIVMGLLMLWIAIAVLGPIYDIITRLPV